MNIINSKEELQLLLFKIPPVFWGLRMIFMFILLAIMMIFVAKTGSVPGFLTTLNKIWTSLPSVQNIISVCGVGLLGSSLYKMNIKNDNDMLSLAAGISSLMVAVPNANKKTIFQIILFSLAMYLIIKGTKTHKNSTNDVTKKIGLFSIIYGIIVMFILFNLGYDFNFNWGVESINVGKYKTWGYNYKVNADVKANLFIPN